MKISCENPEAYSSFSKEKGHRNNREFRPLRDGKMANSISNWSKNIFIVQFYRGSLPYESNKYDKYDS